MDDAKMEMLRHLIATVAFRCRVAVDGAPADFAGFRPDDAVRSPGEILAHIGDLFTGSLYLLKGEFVELNSKPLPWRQEVERCYVAMRELDAYLASGSPLAFPVEKFIQGPIGDALTHVGQIVMLRRMAGHPVRQEPYFTAEIESGSF